MTKTEILQAIARYINLSHAGTRVVRSTPGRGQVTLACYQDSGTSGWAKQTVLFPKEISLCPGVP